MRIVVPVGPPVKHPDLSDRRSPDVAPPAPPPRDRAVGGLRRVVGRAAYAGCMSDRTSGIDPADVERVRELAEAARTASRRLALMSRAEKDAALRTMADDLEQATDTVVEANERDLARGREHGMPESLQDRLRLDGPASPPSPRRCATSPPSPTRSARWSGAAPSPTACRSARYGCRWASSA